MSIKVGDRVPDGTLTEFIETESEGCSLGPNAFQVADLTRGKTIALFALPGAFTPKMCIRDRVERVGGRVRRVVAHVAHEGDDAADVYKRQALRSWTRLSTDLGLSAEGSPANWPYQAAPALSLGLWAA